VITRLQSAGRDGGSAPAPDSPRWSEGAGRTTLRVLVVDDDRDEVLTLVALLRDEGYDARGAYRGKDTLDLVRDFDPQAVLLDIGMPDLNGYDAARLIRSRYGSASPLLIAVTGWKKPSDRLLAELAGFDHHVAKPYDPRLLLSLIRPLETR
jgi:DNA-binding response OmpR family regulator